MLVDVAAERRLHDLVLLERVEGVAQVAGELVDPEMPALAEAHLVDVLVDGWAGVEVLLDAFKTGAQRDGEREVGITGRVRDAQLDAGRGVAPGRDADQGAAVVL